MDTLTVTFESFSRNAADLLRLRRALYGLEDAQALMLRCFRRSKASKISETTVLNCWSEQDETLDNALFDEARERLQGWAK
jgi:hypothetical protein